MLMSSGGAHRLRSVRPEVWVLLLTLACLAPFLSKAYHIDDTLFLKVAERIRRHPFDPFGGNVNWFGTSMQMPEAFQNPPLTSYYIALCSIVTGWTESALHFAFLIPALAAAWGTYSLARLFCERPALASVITIMTPAFLVSATTLMCDMLLLAFWIWALALFEMGLRRGTVEHLGNEGAAPSDTDRQYPAPLYFAGSGLLAGLAVLTKFTGLALVPLFLAYGFTKRTWSRRKAAAGTHSHSVDRVAWVLAPLIPIVVAAAYQWVTGLVYGRGLLLGAASYASLMNWQAVAGVSLADKALYGLMFSGGCFVQALLYLPWLWPRKQVIVGLGLIVPAICFVLLLTPFDSSLWPETKGLNWSLGLQAGLFVVGGLNLLALVMADFSKRGDEVSILLLVWIFGILIFCTFVNWTLNGRSLLPMAPAVGILIARRLPPELLPNLRALWPALAGGVVSLLIAKADYDLAEFGRSAANYFLNKHGEEKHTLLFEGHWGFQYYMERGGAKALDKVHHALKKGEIIIRPKPATNPKDLPSDLTELVETREYISLSPCSAVGPPAEAGFYSHFFGRLPFVLGERQVATFREYRVLQDETVANAAQVQTSTNEAEAEYYFQLGEALLSQHRTAEAVEQYRAGLGLKPDTPAALNNLAWILATDADPRVRNGEEAILLSLRACQLTKWVAAQYIGTLAAAYAEAGRFGEAVATAGEAVGAAEAAGEEGLGDRNRELVKFYRANKAYREK